MTKKEFLKTIQKRYRFEDVVLCCMAILCLAGGIVFAAYISSQVQSWPLRDVIISGIPILMMLSFGSFVFWKMSEFYKVAVFYSDKPVHEKRKLVEDYLKEFDLKIESDSNNLITFSYPWERTAWYQGVFFVQLTICVDDEKILIHARGVTVTVVTANDGGVSRKARLKALAFFEARQ